MKLRLTGKARRYRLGPEAYAVDLAAEPSCALQRVAAPILRSLAMETGDWIFFTVRHGLEAICISRASANKHYPQKALRVGDRHPLGLGTGGLAILAAMPDSQVVLVSTPARLGDERRAALGDRLQRLGEEVMKRALLQAEKSTGDGLSYEEA